MPGSHLLRAHGAPALAALAALASLGAALAVLTGSQRLAVPLLVIAQLCLVLWVGFRAWDDRLQWARPEVLLAAGWALTFTLPSCIYAISPGLMDVFPYPVEAICIVNLSLLSLIVGAAGFRTFRADLSPRAERLQVLVGETRWAVLAIWAFLGLCGFALLFSSVGGPVEYLRNIDDEGRLTRGRVYFVWMALMLRYAAQIVLLRYWASHRQAPWPIIALVTATIGATGLLGARLFVVVALAELAVFYVLVRRPLPVKVAVPVTALLAILLIAVGGAVKRYTNYKTEHPGADKALSAYLVSDAPGELGQAYANNYADGVRLIALARATVPRYGQFEKGKLLLRYVLQPIPRAARPRVERDPAIRRALYPGGGQIHAIPLQATTYLQWGVAAVVLVFGLLGALIAWLDRTLVTTRRATFPTTVVLCAVVVALPAFLRASEAGGFAVAAIEVIGLGLVASTTERHSRTESGPLASRLSPLYWRRRRAAANR